AVRADSATERVRQQVGALAAQDYRAGARPSLLDVLFTAQDPQDLLDRTAALDVVARGRVAALRRLADTRAVALDERARAEAAVDRQQQATAALHLARQRAERSAADAAAALAEVTATRDDVLGRLAALQHTSLALEQQRQQGLALDAAAQAAAWLARQRPAGQAPAAPAGPGSGEGDPNTSGSAGTAGGPPGGGASAAAGEAVVAWARGRIGLPYQWGGAGPDSYDCSGLTMRAWEQAGVELPHYAASQYAESEHVRYASLRPGDLIFYATDTGDPASIHHVTLYAGDGMMIEAPYTGATVRLAPVRWRDAMPWAGRP
ncbi:MAG TPA: NlpC/P60 family protein, partial [Kineosporiaceae bacterium]